ncbi:DUF1796 family putative cysteine peptidase [Paenibacillus pinihumi]|uniref:DUF1796 family putative cysteine peptidase n=1 Tax=Paenibacillus pinihumi TaxID=669462 RepID=UPI00041D0664|nr:DUF1796 family putative cysteine peptidase [Paenibacillus pinihumi]
MKLQDIKGSYNAIYSLGDLCLASIQLKQNNLRTFAGVLDWAGSPILPDVTRLLQNRFAGLMDAQNLRVIGYAGDTHICVSDDTYNFVSNHDFEIGPNSLYHLGTYAEVKAKYDRRIQRFLEKAATSQRMLFVRTEGTLEEAAALQNVLSGLVQHDFKVLVVNHAPVSTIIELDWPLEKVCGIQLPNGEKWAGNNHLWQHMLQGIYLI